MKAYQSIGDMSSIPGIKMVAVNLHRCLSAVARPNSGVARRVAGGSIFGPRFFVYFFINGKSKSPAA